MTNEQKRIAIAEAHQPYIYSYDASRMLDGYLNGWSKCHPDGSFISSTPPADYLNDLNAMHEAIGTLNYELAERFEDELCDICKQANELLENPAPWRFAVANATASQRAEAFLKTIGKL